MKKWVEYILTLIQAHTQYLITLISYLCPLRPVFTQKFYRKQSLKELMFYSTKI